MIGYPVKITMKNGGKHIHMLGICGAGMGALAGLLVAKGFKVTGSDKTAYPPMSDQLKELGIDIKIGFRPENIGLKTDLVIIGNVIRKDNPEAVAVIEKKIPYMSMPKAVAEFFLKDKISLVVTGTHGKTTTTNILAWLLEYAGKKPSFLIGGAGLNFGTSYRYTDGKYFVIEGDEYDTAFFDKGPKFLHYRPFGAIIGSVEFDHADIYRDLEHVKSSFEKFIKLPPKDGVLVANADYKNVIDILGYAKCTCLRYGYSTNCGGTIELIGEEGDFTAFNINYHGKKIKFLSPLMGRHNVSNAAAAIILLLGLGFEPKILVEGLKLFKGVKKRQELKGCINGVMIIDDFAHHPTAIKETIDAVRSRFGGKIWAIFEPRSNTSRRNIFQEELALAMGSADNAIIAGVFHSEDIPKAERLDPVAVIAGINKGTEGKGPRQRAWYLPTADEIVEFLKDKVTRGDVLLVMSNGAFDNIHEKLMKMLDRNDNRKPVK